MKGEPIIFPGYFKLYNKLKLEYEKEFPLKTKEEIFQMTSDKIEKIINGKLRSGKIGEIK